MNLYDHILGCLLGTAVGDAVGLRREGLSRRRAKRMYGESPLKASLIFGMGLCSDDTEHTQMVGHALALSGGDIKQFERKLAHQFRLWLLTLPAGIGLATLRSCCKLLIGFTPKQSGVFSAGNGPAMRSALIGLYANSVEQLEALVKVNTRITHTDPKAEEGALLIARAAQQAINENKINPTTFLEQSIPTIEGTELKESMSNAATMLSKGKTCEEYADSQGWKNGITGYINQTVPAALYCWANSPNDFRQSIENAVLLGGDTDSVAAITGAISGAHLGSEHIPTEWINQIAEFPRTINWMKELASIITKSAESQLACQPNSMHWLATIPRNIIFATVVLGLGFRRLLPPY